MLDASERRCPYRPDPGDTELEKLSRRRRGNPRSVPQFEHRIRDLLSGFRMALVLGSDGASKPKWRARPDLPRLRPRNDRGHRGRSLHAYHRPDAGRAAPCRRRPAARLHGDRSSAGHGNADACDVRRIERLRRGGLRPGLAMVQKPERRRWTATAARAGCQTGAAGAVCGDTLSKRRSRRRDGAAHAQRPGLYRRFHGNDAAGVVAAGAVAKDSAGAKTPANLGRYRKGGGAAGECEMPGHFGRKRRAGPEGVRCADRTRRVVGYPGDRIRRGRSSPISQNLTIFISARTSTHGWKKRILRFWSRAVRPGIPQATRHGTRRSWPSARARSKPTWFTRRWRPDITSRAT